MKLFVGSLFLLAFALCFYEGRSIPPGLCVFLCNDTDNLACCDGKHCYYDTFWIEYDSCGDYYLGCCGKLTSQAIGVICGGGIGFCLLCVVTPCACCIFLCIRRRRAHVVHHYHPIPPPYAVNSFAPPTTYSGPYSTQNIQPQGKMYN